MALSLLGSATWWWRVDRPFLLRRGLKRSALPLLGSANLVHPGLRPNGPSNIASRHRLRRSQCQRAAALANRRQGTIHPLWKDETSELGRTIERTFEQCVSPLPPGKGRVPGKRLQSNRWVGG